MDYRLSEEYWEEHLSRRERLYEEYKCGLDLKDGYKDERNDDDCEEC